MEAIKSSILIENCVIQMVKVVNSSLTIFQKDFSKISSILNFQIKKVFEGQAQ